MQSQLYIPSTGCVIKKNLFKIKENNPLQFDFFFLVPFTILFLTEVLIRVCYPLSNLYVREGLVSYECINYLSKCSQYQTPLMNIWRINLIYIIFCKFTNQVWWTIYTELVIFWSFYIPFEKKKIFFIGMKTLYISIYEKVFSFFKKMFL